MKSWKSCRTSWLRGIWVLLISALPSYAQAQTVDIRVHGDSGLAIPNPPNPGDTWPNAYKYLHDALVRADFLLDLQLASTVRLWVAAANDPYRPDQSAANEAGSLNPAATFSLRNNVEIYGGFVGTEVELSQRDPIAHGTVLSGSSLEGGAAGGNCPNPAGGDCLTATPGIPGCQNELCCSVICGYLPICCSPQVGWIDGCADEAANVPECVNPPPMAAYHVVTANGVDLTARLDGFTITGGIAAGTDLNADGGGLLVTDASPMVVQCTFRENSATNGGAARIDLGDNEPRFINCEFVANAASAFGGAVFTERAGIFTNCLFSANSAGTSGGAIIMVGSTAQALVTNCTFGGNTAAVNAGGLLNQDPDALLTVANCVLWDNEDGGGTTEDAQIFLGATGTASVSHSCIQGLQSGGPFDTAGNIGANPLFLSPLGADGIARTGDEDLRLHFNSACNDEGDDGAVPGDIANLDGDTDTIEPTPLDIALARRFSRASGLHPCDVGTVDMGAYENSDCDANGTRDELDPDANGDGIPDACQNCNQNGLFDPVEIADCPGDPACSDCNENGVPDECDIAGDCDSDKNANGIPDGCECAPESVDIVFIVDVSGSMTDDFADICTMADQIVSDLADFPNCLEVQAHYLSIVSNPPPPPTFDCSSELLITGSVVGLVGSAVVPGNPGRCGPVLDSPESWASATASVAGLHAWRPLASRIIVPISDEGPCRGSTEGQVCSTVVGSDDWASVANAITISNLNNVFVFPITGFIEDLPGRDCIRSHADNLAVGTDSAEAAFHVEDIGSYQDVGVELALAVADIAETCNPSSCTADIVPDCDVNVTDLLWLLAHYSPDLTPCTDCCGPTCAADIDDDCVVAVLDLLALLAQWYADCGCSTISLESGSEGPGQQDLLEALNDIGFADLAHYNTWAVGADESEVFYSGVLLVLALVTPGD